MIRSNSENELLIVDSKSDVYMTQTNITLNAFLSSMGSKLFDPTMIINATLKLSNYIENGQPKDVIFRYYKNATT